MNKLTQEWFEFKDYQSRFLAKSVWIPVYGEYTFEKNGKYPEIGYIEEIFDVGSSIIFKHKRKEAEELGYNLFLQDHNSNPELRDNGEYLKAESFETCSNDPIGFRIVLIQDFNPAHEKQIFINQDFLMAYRLIKEDDLWVRPNEGYKPVVKLERNENGSIGLVSIRAEYLKDYLAARTAALRVYYYRERRAILNSNPKFDWPDDCILSSKIHDQLEVQCNEINASGTSPGDNWGIFKAWRTDVDPGEDIPDFSDMNKGIKTESMETSTG